jgi:hypothetical protein
VVDAPPAPEVVDELLEHAEAASARVSTTAALEARRRVLIVTGKPFVVGRVPAGIFASVDADIRDPT